MAERIKDLDNMVFELLQKDDIECKAEVVGTRIKVSLHVKASTCTRLLNEQVGAMNWEKEYTNGNKNCIVRIWDEKKQRMISKEDCGGGLTDIDGYKGQASNGFKRTCALGWGLGIELYSQPLITFPATDSNTTLNNRREKVVNEDYCVKEIEYNEKDRKITHCVIEDSRHNIVYDGPDENGDNKIFPVEIVDDDEPVIIPDDADLMNSEDDCDMELPDNTDGFEEPSVTAENANDREFCLMVDGTPAHKKNFYIFSAIDTANDNPVQLMFNLDTLPDWYDKFAAKVSMEETKLMMVGEQKNEYILYKRDVNTK